MLKPTAWIILAILSITSYATFADPTTSPSSIAGNWKWSISIGDNNIDMSAKLKLDGDKITGTFVDGFDNTSYEITDGKLDGQNITFKVSRPLQDSKIESTYTGKLDGDTIKGKIDITMTALDPTNVDWNAKRAKDDSATTAPSN